MCKFFSVTSDGLGNIKYFDWEIRKRILSGELRAEADSHTSINDYFGFKGAMEDCRNKYEYNPLTGKFTIDMINSIDDSKEVEAIVKKLDFKTICEPLNIKAIIHPFRLKSCFDKNKHIELLKQWASVRDSVWASVWASVRDSVGASVRDSVRASVRDSVRDSVWASVWDSVGASVRDSVRASVRDSVWASVWAYISSFFYIEKWEYIEHEPFNNPYQPLIDLWESGIVPSFDGTTWRLHAGEKADIIFEISQDKLRNWNDEDIFAPLLSISDCAKRLNVTDRTVYNHVKSGELKAHKIGKQWRIKPEDLAKYINGGGDNV